MRSSETMFVDFLFTPSQLPGFSAKDLSDYSSSSQPLYV
jgi:hypothetical protein